MTACTAQGAGGRLPTKDELKTAITDQFTNNGSNPGGFKANTLYWTSTGYSGDRVWYAGYYTTSLFTNVDSKIIDTVSVRCLVNSPVASADSNQNYGTALVGWDSILRLIQVLR